MTRWAPRVSGHRPRWMAWALAALVTLGLARGAPAQELPRWGCRAWERIGPDVGLPSARVYALAWDGERMWAGTAAGLAVGDDRGWRKVEAPGMPPGPVWALAVARNRDLWLGTTRGLVRYTGGRVDPMTVMDSGLPADLVLDVTLAGDVVWVATSAGPASFDPATGRWRVWVDRPAPAPGTTTSLTIIDGTPWATSMDSGAWRFDGQAWHRTDADDPMTAGLGVVPLDGGVVTAGPRGLSGTSGPTLEGWPGSAPRVIGLWARGETLFIGTERGLVVHDPTGWYRYVRPKGARHARLVAPAPARGVRTWTLAADVPAAPVRDMVLVGRDLWVATGDGIGRCTVGRAPSLELTAKGDDRAFGAMGSIWDDRTPASRPKFLDPWRQPVVDRVVRLGVVDGSPEGEVLRGVRAAMSGFIPARVRFSPRPPMVSAQALVASPQRAWTGAWAAEAMRLGHVDHVMALVAGPDPRVVPELLLASWVGELPMVILGVSEPRLQDRAPPWVSMPGPQGPIQASAMVRAARDLGWSRITLVTRAEPGPEVQWMRSAAGEAGVPGPEVYPLREEQIPEVPEHGGLVLWLPVEQASRVVGASGGRGGAPWCLAPASLATRDFLALSRGKCLVVSPRTITRHEGRDPGWTSVGSLEDAARLAASYLAWVASVDPTREHLAWVLASEPPRDLPTPMTSIIDSAEAP